MKPEPEWYISDKPTLNSRLKLAWDIGTFITAIGFSLVAFGFEELLKWMEE